MRHVLALLLAAGCAASARAEVLPGAPSPQDLRGGGQWLVGRFVQRKAGIAMNDLPQGIASPGIWEGLPDDAVNHGGFLLDFEGNVGRSQSLGVNYYTIAGGYYFTFDNISNDAHGFAEDRILDALRSPWGHIMRPCSIDAVASDQAFAFPDAAEARAVLDQQPSQMDGVRARLVHPRYAYLFNAQSLKIEPLESARVVCFGFMHSIAPGS